jgi:hypothetical protein
MLRSHTLVRAFMMQTARLGSVRNGAVSGPRDAGGFVWVVRDLARRGRRGRTADRCRGHGQDRRGACDAGWRAGEGRSAALWTDDSAGRVLPSGYAADRVPAPLCGIGRAECARYELPALRVSHRHTQAQPGPASLSAMRGPPPRGDKAADTHKRGGAARNPRVRSCRQCSSGAARSRQPLANRPLAREMTEA